MSQYIEFYLKDKKTNRYLPIGTFGRSTVEYQYGNEYVPYEKAEPLTQEIIAKIIGDINDTQLEINKSIVKFKETKDLIAKMDNPVAEKLESLQEVNGNISECENDLYELQRAYWFYNTLHDIIDEVIYGESDYGSPTDYVWAGVECGNPGDGEE